MKKLLLLPFLLLVIPVANAMGVHHNIKFMTAVYSGYLTALSHEIETDLELDINQKNAGGYSGLMLAALFGKKDVVGYLLEVEEIDIYCKRRGQTALDIAMRRNSHQVIEMLQARIAKDLKEVNRRLKKIKETTFTTEQKEKLAFIKIYEEDNLYKWIGKNKKGGRGYEG